MLYFLANWISASSFHHPTTKRKKSINCRRARRCILLTSVYVYTKYTRFVRIYMQPESLFIHMTLVETKAAAAAAHIERHTLYNRECFSKMYGCQTSRRNTLLRYYVNTTRSVSSKWTSLQIPVNGLGRRNVAWNATFTLLLYILNQSASHSYIKHYTENSWLSKFYILYIIREQLTSLYMETSINCVYYYIRIE